MTMTMQRHGIPESDVDLYGDETLSDPHPVYEHLRELGPVVWMSRHGVFAFPRYQEVKDALGDWRLYSSADGVGLNDIMNAVKGVLNRDPPEHTLQRRLLMPPLTTKALRGDVERQIHDEAARLAQDVVERREIDGLADLAQRIPMMVISRLVGLPEDGRARMLAWASDGFDVQGPMNARTERALAGLAEVQEYLAAHVHPHTVTPGSWAASLLAAAREEGMSAEEAQVMVLAYVIPSLDTTIQAIAAAIWLFARHPEQWTRLREDPALLASAINEVLRLEAPVQAFSRVVTRDHEVAGFALPRGSRVLMMFASANRDERHWPAPQTFDIGRQGASQHLAFGLGEHVCMGQGLARLEMRAVLSALADRVEAFELGSVQRMTNNTLRGFTRMELRVV